MKKLALVFAAALALTACTAAPTETATVPRRPTRPPRQRQPSENADAAAVPGGGRCGCVMTGGDDTDTASVDTLYGHVDTTELTGLKAGLCRRRADQAL